MTQLCMFPEISKTAMGQKKGRFTYAFNSYPEGNARWGWYSSITHAEQDDADTCLIFNTDDIESVLRTDFLYTFNKPRLWFVAVPPRRVIVSTQMPRMYLDEYSTATIKLRLPTTMYTIAGKELACCMLLYRIANDCCGCDHEHDAKACMAEQLRRVAEKQGLPPGFFVDSDDTDDDGFDVDTLKKMAPALDWELVPPYRTVDDMFSSEHVAMDAVSFDAMEDIVAQRHARAQAAADTRKAVKRCEKECHFAKHCYVAEAANPWAGPLRKPYAHIAKRCQEQYGGPVTQQEMLACLPHVLDRFPNRRTREEITWVARNAGATTRLFGNELILGRMCRDLNLVEMYRPTTREQFNFRYEDVVTMLNTPFYHKGYYQRPNVVNDVPEMSDEMLLSYIALCDVDRLKSYVCAYVFQSATPYIYEVGWNPRADELQVITFPGGDWRYTFKQLAQAYRAQGSYEPIPGIISPYLDKVRASAGMDSSETSSDKPL